MRLKEATRKNVHQTHLEDLVLLGVDGFNELNDKVEKFLRRFSSEEKELNLTQKIDGAPALFCWSKYPGYPDNSIALKGFATGPQNSMSSPEQVDAKYSDRPDMAAKLKLGLQLAKYIPAGECWQGDCLFSKGDLREEEINGTNYLTFMPNKIVYAFSEDNADYNKVRNADFGIAFHTIYKDKNGEMTQGFDVDPTRLNDVPSNFYIMSPAISASRDVHDYDIEALNKEFNVLKSYENKLANNNAYNELINNASFMNYWNTFENATLADKKQVNINVGTFVQELKDYIKDKQTKEYNKKLSTLKTDQGRDKAAAKFNSDVERLDNIVETNKSVLSDLVNALNAAANIKMLMWDGLRKSKNDYSTYYKSRTKGYIPAEGEGIAMSDMDGNIVKIVDRSTFSSYNRDPDIMSGFEHESLELHEDLNPALKKALGDKEPEFKQLLKKLILDHSIYNNDIYPLGIYREDRDKGTNQELAHKFWLDKFGLDTSKRGMSSAITSAIMSASHEIEDSDEYKDTLDWDDPNRLPKDEQFKINLFYEWDAIRKDPFGEYSEDDPRKHMSFRKFLQNKLDSGDYDDDHEEQLIIDAIEDVKGGSGYFREMLATQRGDMGSFNKFIKKLTLDESDSQKTAVVAFGRFNPPHIGHRKLAKAMADAAHGEKAKIYLSHKVNSIKDPLSYDSKLRWAQKEWGDLVDVVPSKANNAWEVLEELYNQGYTDIIYAGGEDRIGGSDDIYGALTTNKEHNEYVTKGGDLLYKFNSITPLNAGRRDPDSFNNEEKASASLLRKLVAEDNFDEFKKFVYLNEADAYSLFKELKYSMKGREESFVKAANNRIMRLREASRNITSLNKGNYTPDMERELDKELKRIDPELEAPDPNKGANDYMSNVDDYTGLYVKQTGKTSAQTVVYNTKDIQKLHQNDGERINKELGDLVINDDKGKLYKINPTGSPSVITGKFKLANPTFYQEAIYSLLLMGKVRQNDIITWLAESDAETGSGIFKYINVDNNYNPKTFKNEWASFISDWGKTFIIAQQNSSTFMSDVSSETGINGIKSATILHPGVKSSYSALADSLLKGADKFDKSDFYICTGDSSEIGNAMLKLRNDYAAYAEFMMNNRDKIVGISLKKVTSSMRIVWDIPAKEPTYFKSVELRKTDAPTQVLVLNGSDGNTYNFQVKTNSSKGSITMEWSEKGASAQMGKAIYAFDVYAADTPLVSKKSLQERCRNSTKKMAMTILAYLTGNNDVEAGTTYNLSEQGAEFITDIFNLSCGYQGKSPSGVRITAPYIKVY